MDFMRVDRTRIIDGNFSTNINACNDNDCLNTQKFSYALPVVSNKVLFRHFVTKLFV